MFELMNVKGFGMRLRIRSVQTVVLGLVASVLVPGLDANLKAAVAAPPAAPSPVGPANGASVTIPLTISWSQVPDAGGYNWEISLTSSFATVLEHNLALLWARRRLKLSSAACRTAPTSGGCRR